MDRPAAAIMKHNNPCGVAYGKTVFDAYDRANMADRIAAFGGCLVVNRAMDKQTAELANSNYLEVVAAPGLRGRRGRDPCEAQEPADHQAREDR